MIIDEAQLEGFHAHAEDEAVKYFEQNKLGEDVNNFRKELKVWIRSTDRNRSERSDQIWLDRL